MGQIGRRIDKAVDILIIGLNGGFLILLTTMTFVEVFTRYIWGFSTSQVSSWCVFFLMWISFSAIGIAHKDKKHIVMSTLGEYLAKSGKVRVGIYLSLLINTTVLLFSVIFLYLGIVIVAKAKATGYHTTIDYVPHYWLWYLSLPVGCLSLFAYGIRDIVGDIRRLIELKSDPQNTPQILPGEIK